MNDDRRVQGRLPCGTDLETLLHQVAEGRGAERSAHQASCSHCQTALAEFERLWEPVRRLAAERIRVPARLVASVMRRIREFAASWQDVLLQSGRGTTRIAAWVVAKISALVAAEVPGVWAVFGWAVRMSPHKAFAPFGSAPGDVAEAAPQKVAIDLELATTHGVPIHEVAEAVRRSVARQLHAMTGLEVAQVDVVVEEVIFEE